MTSDDLYAALADVMRDVFDRDVFSGINVCSTCHEGRLTVHARRQGNRPVGVTVDTNRGALIVADDLSNTIWRVTAAPNQQSNLR